MAHLPEDKPALKHLMPGYDPVKAHEYYMRVRQLHPRQRGMLRPTSSRTGAIAPQRPSILAQPAAQQLARQRAAAQAAITSLETKLVELKNILGRKKAALNRDKKLQNATPTATTKAKAAQQSKQYRQAHKQQLKIKAKQAAAKAGNSRGGSTASTTKNVVDNPKSGSIKEVEAAIQTVETALTAAKVRLKALG